MVKKIKIRTNILSHFILVIVSMAAILLGLQYHYSEQMAVEATSQSFRLIAERIRMGVLGRDALAREDLALMELYPQVGDPVGETLPMELITRFAQVMKRNNDIYAIYTGRRDGDLLQLVNMRSSEELHAVYDAPANSRWLLLKVFDSPDGRIRSFDFFDASFGLLQHRSDASEYRADVRPWFVQAMETRSSVRIDPYRFANLKQMGISFSKRIAGTDAVLALDFTLRKLGDAFQGMKFDPSSRIFMFGRDGEVIASSEPQNDRATTWLSELIASGDTKRVVRHDRNGNERFGMVEPLTNEMGEPTWLGFSVDASAMLRPYHEKVGMALAVALLLVLLSLPLVRWMTSRIVEPIYDLMGENHKIEERRFDEVKLVKTNIVELDRLSHSLLDMSDSIRAYQEKQKGLMHSFIRLIADAIDAKSPYTGGHCKRVPEIALMLAREADAAIEEPFSDFKFSNREAWEEFEMGAWLHDCGKITTPEYVVDKATKLETIYNRIHEIRTRFEILWRDVEIDYHEKLGAGAGKEGLDAWKAEQHRLLREEFEFIAQVNIGGEFMSGQMQDRVRTIAERTWTRHFDDRLGLSDNELARYAGIPAPPLPVEEPLLADRPEHRVERTGFDMAAYASQGFKLEVPELLYNYGEIHNLCIQKGTLTAEERFKINEHVIMSIRMLETLSFPDHMRLIPEYAGTHHEKLDGKGYPRQWNREQLSVPARIMAIADIFEALTASDRPYKKSKTLSQAFEIMGFMVKDSHIDQDLFNLFLRSGVWLEYAKKHLDPEQIDEVDIEACTA